MEIESDYQYNHTIVNFSVRCRENRTFSAEEICQVCLNEDSPGSSYDSSYSATMHFFFTILANPELEPHAPNTCQSKLRYRVFLHVLLATNVRDPHLGHE